MLELLNALLPYIAAVSIVIAFLAGLCVGQSAAYRHVREMNSRK
jgi:hypothetical protein